MTNPPPAAQKLPIFLLKTRSVPCDGYEEYFQSTTATLDLHDNAWAASEYGYEPVFVPVLEHKFDAENENVIRDLLRDKEIRRDGSGKYGGMIFTSQRAVESFARLVEEGIAVDEASPLSFTSSWPHLRDIPIYTVGPATSRALSSIPTTPPLKIYGSECGNGGVLAEYILQHYKSTYYPLLPKPPPLLFLVGEVRRDIIPKTLQNPALPPEDLVPVHELTVYGTGVMESFSGNFRKLLQKSSGFDGPVPTSDADGSSTRPALGIRWVVVFSPTGCAAMLEELDMLDVSTGRVKTGERGGGCGNRRNRTFMGQGGEMQTFIATIGPTTRDYLRKTFGFEADVCAETPSPEGIGKGIQSFMTGLGR